MLFREHQKDNIRASLACFASHMMKIGKYWYRVRDRPNRKWRN